MVDMWLPRRPRSEGYGQRDFRGPLAALHAALDEILQYALVAQQAVPWLFSGLSRRSLF